MNIKRIDDYTKAELLDLKDDQIQKIIQWELAENGVKLLTKPKEPECYDIPDPDKKIYEVSLVDVAFDKKEIAEEVAKIIRNNFSTLRHIEHHWGEGTGVKTDISQANYYGSNKLEDIVVKEVRTYSTDLYNQIKANLTENARLKEAYKKEKEEYDTWEATSQETVTYVWNKIREVRNEQNEKEQMLKRFEEYLSLANNDSDIAWKFLKKAYTVSQEQEDYIKNEISRPF